MTDKVMEILNNDENSKRIKKTFLAEMDRQGLEGKELEEARTDMMMFCIANNKEAMKEMAKETYNKIRA